MGTVGLWVLELFAVYDGWTDGRTELSNAYCPLPYDLGHKFTELFKNGNSVDLRGIIVVYDQSIADT